MEQCDISTCAEADVLNTTGKLLQDLKSYLCQKSRTAKLWINYIEYLDIVKRFIRAERCGDWSGHLYAVSEMLNLFAATGHFNYAKSARVYLQEMLDLPINYPWLYREFSINGFHTIR